MLSPNWRASGSESRCESACPTKWTRTFMRYRRNVRVHFVGHADSQRLSEPLARQFGDNMGLSRERAGEVAEYFKKTLGLPPEAITYEWVGDTQPVASNDTEEGRALNRRVEVEVWYDEVRKAPKEEEVVVADDIKRIKVCRTETVCKMRYKEGQERRARVRNLVVPLRYEDDTTPISEAFIQRIRESLANLHDKQNLAIKFIGYTDDAPLSARDERIYGTPLALSKARARRVALAMKDALKLPTSVIDSDGRGASQPLASNETVQGRALNRRVEVEFWYDDPLQELPDEPQLCPGDVGEEVTTKVYDPPWGTLAELALQDGQPIIPPGYAADLRRALTDIADRTNPRLRFTGYTKNERLDRRTVDVYGDDVAVHVHGAPVEALVLRVAGEPQTRVGPIGDVGQGATQVRRVAGRDNWLAVLERELREGAPGGIVDLGRHFLAHIAGAELRLVRQLLERIVVPELHLDATIQRPPLHRLVGGERLRGAATVAVDRRGRHLEGVLHGQRDAARSRPGERPRGSG